MYDLGRNLELANAVEMAKPLNPSLKQRLDWAVQRAEEQLAKAKRAREILEKHPELEELIDIMNKGLF